MSGETGHDLASAFDFDDDVDLPESVDGAAVERMRAVAWLLDESVRIPGTELRIGVDPLLGAIPGAGDAIGAGLSMYIVLESARLGVTYTTLLCMLGNVAVDVAGGSIPYAGGVFDALWKANERNLELALTDLADDPSPDDGGSDDDPIEIEIE